MGETVAVQGCRCQDDQEVSTGRSRGSPGPPGGRGKTFGWAGVEQTSPAASVQPFA